MLEKKTFKFLFPNNPHQLYLPFYCVNIKLIKSIWCTVVVQHTYPTSVYPANWIIKVNMVIFGGGKIFKMKLIFKLFSFRSVNCSVQCLSFRVPYNFIVCDFKIIADRKQIIYLTFFLYLIEMTIIFVAKILLVTECHEIYLKKEKNKNQ